MRSKIPHGFYLLWLCWSSAYGGAFLLGCATSPVATAFAEPVVRKLEISGKIIQEIALRLDAPRRLTKLRQQLWLTERWRLSDRCSLRSTQRVRYDPVFALSNEFSRAARSDEQWAFDLRDTYLDYSNGPLDVRIGKQQIVWGESVGLFFADVVNAKDLREYVLPDFDLIRIPQWAVDVELAHEPWHLETVWLPFLQFNKLGVSGSAFAFPLPAPPGLAFTVQDPSKPPNSFKNGELGVRLSYLRNGWDVGLFYFHGWDRFPTLYRSIAASVYHFAPKYQPANLVGGSCSKEIADIVFKGEFVVNPKGRFATFDGTDGNGIVAKPFVDYLVGADYTFFGKLETGVQFMQRIIGHHADLMEEDTTRTHISVWAKMGFFNGTVEPEFLLLTGLAEQDLLYRPKITVKLSDRWQWRAGADIFQGKPSGLFGRFDKQSRVYTEFSYHF